MAERIFGRVAGGYPWSGGGGGGEERGGVCGGVGRL